MISCNRLRNIIGCKPMTPRNKKMKIFSLVLSCLCLLLAGRLMAREIATEEAATIRGKLSISNAFVYITTTDSVSGKGNGVELHNEPVHRFVVSTGALPPTGRASRAEEPKKL